MIFNPSKGALANHFPKNYGYVATLKQLPTANARCEGNVVFCDEDKRFYECIHVHTEEENYYRWTAVTSGGQRSFFIPVEGLNEKELPVGDQPKFPKRSNSFDAIASALNEIAIGLSRYNIRVDPLCFEPCDDTRYVDGRVYYVWNNNYDRSDYVVTKDTDPIAGKPYFIENDVYRYETVVFGSDSHFDRTKVYFESTRPIFIPDTKVSPGELIDHRVFVSNGQNYDNLALPDLVTKANEIIDVINVTNCKLVKVTDNCTLFDLAALVNELIDEVNPFSNSLNILFQRMNALESLHKLGTLESPFEFPFFAKKEDIVYKLDLSTASGDAKLVITPVE